MKKLLIAAAFMGVALLPVVASAAGNDAVVSAEVNAEGELVITSTKDLSNVHVVLCDGTITKFDGLDSPEFSPDLNVSGGVVAVLAKSGNNTTAEAEALLTALGGTVHGNSTGAIALNNPEACQPEEPTPTTTTTVPDQPTTTTTVPDQPTTTTTEPPATTTTTEPEQEEEIVVPLTTSSPPAGDEVVTELATTGFASNVLGIIGGLLLISGLVSVFLGKAIKFGGSTA